MMSDSPLDDNAILQLNATGLRACVIAMSIASSGGKVSLSEVARQVGVSRQALHQSNPAAVGFIAWLRHDWTPPPEQQSDSQKLSDRVAALEAKVKAERKKRIQAEQALTMSRHHLQLAVENLEAEIANKPKTGSLARARASRRPMTN